MGRFVNPDNSAFQVMLNSEIYVDKTELLEYTNKVLNTDRAMICNSRPRRFGKSVTANMIAAYYSRGCESEKMFDGLKISRSDTFKEHLNRYDVIHFDVQWCIEPAGSPKNVISYIKKSVIEELREAYPGILPDTITSLADALSCINAMTGKKFIVIIDEWDVLIRDDAANQTVQEEYINFLRGLFKGTEPTKFIHLAYLTGILPIKKFKTQSALNNFDEFTMLDASVLAPYVGFIETEVRYLCEKYHRNYDDVKRWYDGYQLAGYQVYNPKAVVSVMLRGEFQSYWSQTGTYESIVPLISMDFDGLKAAVITMLSGERVKVKTKTYQNDMVTFKNKDDVMTSLIHLGYLAYDQKNQTAFIPNEEIRSEFLDVVEENKWSEFIAFQHESESLLEATLDMDEEAVAEGIEKIHTEYASSIQYNNENSLSSVLTIAYLSSMQYYFKPIREMPAGRGFADFVFVPKTEYIGEYPALLVELKWNKNVKAAIQQMKEKKYPSALESYTGDILLVGVNYDKKSKEHQCVIEKFEK
ncbi:MAG: AAA family ATPase [bacterium]|nr:AAA family ATPase [bacterium]